MTKLLLTNFRSIICQMALSIKNAQQIKYSGVNSVKTSFDCEQPYNLSCTIYNAALYRSLTNISINQNQK